MSFLRVTQLAVPASCRAAILVLERMTMTDEPHVYLSTSCLHGRHDYCADLGGMAGPKVPARCKFCQAPCVCDCHRVVASPWRRIRMTHNADDTILVEEWET